jgi:hypothetical protein
VLLGLALEGIEVLVNSTVEGFEGFFRQALFILIADVNASFLKGVNKGGIGANIGHGIHEHSADLGVGELRFFFPAFMPLHREGIISRAGW